MKEYQESCGDSNGTPSLNKPPPPPKRDMPHRGGKYISEQESHEKTNLTKDNLSEIASKEEKATIPPPRSHD